MYRYVATYQQYQQEGANTNILMVKTDKKINNWYAYPITGKYITTSK